MAPSRALCSLQITWTTWVRRELQVRPFSATPFLRSAGESRLPRVAQTSFWASLIPRALRRPNDHGEATERAQIKAARSKEWNPAAIFIVLGLLVGSNAINTIALRNEMLGFSRKTDAKLALLREVIQKVKDGEEVDVKRVLGTGDPHSEGEWEEVMRELESTDMLWEGRKKREAKKARNLEQQMRDAALREGSSIAPDSKSAEGATERRPKFLM